MRFRNKVEGSGSECVGDNNCVVSEISASSKIRIVSSSYNFLFIPHTLHATSNSSFTNVQKAQDQPDPPFITLWLKQQAQASASPSLLMNVHVPHDHGASSSVRSITADGKMGGGAGDGVADGVALVAGGGGKRLTISCAGVAGASRNHPWPNW